MGIASVYRYCTDMEWRSPSVSKPCQYACLSACGSVSPLTECTLSSTCFGLHSISGKPVRLPDCPEHERASPYKQTEPLLFQYIAIISHRPTVHHYQESSSIPDGGCPPCRYQGLLSSLTEAIPSPGWASPAPSASPHKASASVLTIQVALWWNFSSLLVSSLYWGTQNWTQYSLCGLYWVLSRRSSHFLQFAGCAPAHAAQGANGLLCCLWTEGAERTVQNLLTLNFITNFILVNLKAEFRPDYIAFSPSTWALTPIMSWRGEQ